MSEKALNFTTERLGKLTCPEGTDRVYYRDAKTLGLALCVTSTGAKTFYVYRRVLGKPTRVRLGLWPAELSVDTARKEAQKANGQIVQGIDPRQAKRESRAEMTFGGLWADYLEKHARPHKRTWEEDERQYNRYLQAWRGRRLSQIRRADVHALHSKLGTEAGPYQANRVLALVRAMFSKAAPEGTLNPAIGVKKFAEQSRERFLRADELPTFFAAVAAEPEPFADFFLVALLTGARRGNVQAMQWADVNLFRAEWTIPHAASKSGKPVTLPLAPEVVEVLARRQAMRDGSPFVFAGRGKSGHLTEPKGAWQRVLNRAGIADLRLHDLRRTLGSWQAASGASLPIIGKSLGHRPGSTATAIYARLELDPVRASVNTATSAMLAAAKKGGTA